MNPARPRQARANRMLTVPLVCAAAVSTLAGCSGGQDTRGEAEPERARAETLYVARLAPLNASVTGSSAKGEVAFRITGDDLTIQTDASGLPPGISHWQHFHGFIDGRDAACPTDAADANGDGIVDLIETEPVAGTTMVPFNADPVALNVPDETYPKADAEGTLHYEKTVSLSALQAAYAKAFEGGKLDLDTRVVFLHGVPSATALASSVASLGPIPAQVTIPIACGEIERVEQ